MATQTKPLVSGLLSSQSPPLELSSKPVRDRSTSARMLISFGLLCLAGVVAGSAAVLTNTMFATTPLIAAISPGPTPYTHLQQQLPTLSFSEAHSLLRESRLSARLPAPQLKIKHMVVLFVENRAADHIFGCMLGDRPDFDGIPTRKDGGHWKLFPAEAGSGDRPAAKMVNVSCGTAYQVFTLHSPPTFFVS